MNSIDVVIETGRIHRIVGGTKKLAGSEVCLTAGQAGQV